MSEYLTEKEAAELIGVSTRTLQAWRRKDENPRLPYIKLGNSKRSRVRYRREDVEKFMTPTIASTQK